MENDSSENECQNLTNYTNSSARSETVPLGEANHASKPTNEYFGVRLSRARKSAGYTLRRLAELSKVSVPTLNRWEQGYVTEPRPDKLRYVAMALGLEPVEQIYQWLQDGEEAKVRNVIFSKPELVNALPIRPLATTNPRPICEQGDSFLDAVSKSVFADRHPFEYHMLRLAWNQLRAGIAPTEDPIFR